MGDVCNVCNEIISGRIITALDKKWHPEHFLCYDCKKPISGSFHEKNGSIYCEKDFAKSHTKKCKGCGKPITDRIITAMGESWHDEHFVCKKCKKPIGSSSFMQHDGHPYCSECHTKHVAPKCAECKKPIETKTIIAFDKKWHEECFRCGKCKSVVRDSSFAVKDNKPLCGVCAKA